MTVVPSGLYDGRFFGVASGKGYFFSRKLGVRSEAKTQQRYHEIGGSSLRLTHPTFIKNTEVSLGCAA
jgi:hypothetical protein